MKLAPIVMRLSGAAIESLPFGQTAARSAAMLDSNTVRTGSWFGPLTPASAYNEHAVVRRLFPCAVVRPAAPRSDAARRCVAVPQADPYAAAPCAAILVAVGLFAPFALSAPFAQHDTVAEVVADPVRVAVPDAESLQLAPFLLRAQPLWSARFDLDLSDLTALEGYVNGLPLELVY